jgi:hypothetical protein
VLTFNLIRSGDVCGPTKCLSGCTAANWDEACTPLCCFSFAKPVAQMLLLTLPSCERDHQANLCNVWRVRLVVLSHAARCCAVIRFALCIYDAEVLLRIYYSLFFEGCDDADNPDPTSRPGRNMTLNASARRRPLPAVATKSVSGRAQVRAPHPHLCAGPKWPPTLARSAPPGCHRAREPANRVAAQR